MVKSLELQRKIRKGCLGFITINYSLDIPIDSLARAFESEGELKLLSFSLKLLRVKARCFDLTAVEGSKTIRVVYHCEGEMADAIQKLVENKLLSLKFETN